MCQRLLLFHKIGTPTPIQLVRVVIDPDTGDLRMEPVVDEPEELPLEVPETEDSDEG